MKQFLNTTLRNVIWFKQIHQSGELDMKPDFQRNQVWTNKQKSYLIDTILRGYPIPEIYIQELIDIAGMAKYLIIDGQQRIKSILQFMEGKYFLNGEDSPEWADMYFDDLSMQDKKKIYEYNFVIRILPEMSEGEIRSIFQRLNRNVVVLNKQELRQATYWGEFISLMNNIANRKAWKKIGAFSQNDVRRMLDVEFISEITVAMLNGIQNKKDKLDDYYRIYEEQFDEKDEISEAFEVILGEIIRILPEISYTRWSKKTDFYTLFLVMYENINQLPLSEEKRSGLYDDLIKFGKEVDMYQKTSSDKKERIDNENIVLYSNNIRASSDFGSRKRRDEALNNYLKEVFIK